MGKFIDSYLVSLDCVFAGLSGEIDGHVVDETFHQYLQDLINRVSAILLDRVTFSYNINQ